MKTCAVIILMLVVCSMGGNAMAFALPTGKDFYKTYTVPDSASAELSVKAGESATIPLDAKSVNKLKENAKDTFIESVASSSGTVSVSGTIGPAATGAFSSHKVIITSNYTPAIINNYSLYCGDPVGCPNSTVNIVQGYTTSDIKTYVNHAEITLTYPTVIGDYPSDLTVSDKFTLTQNTTFRNDGVMKDDYQKIATAASNASKLLKAVSLLKASAASVLKAIVSTFNSEITKINATSTATALAYSAAAAIVGVGLTLVLGGSPVVAIAMGLAGFLLSATASIFQVWANDPPDFNYTEQVSLDYATVPKIELGDSDVAQESETFINNIILVDILQAAALDSYEKYQGAFLDELNLGIDTSIYQESQINQMLVYLDQSVIAWQQAGNSAKKLGTFSEVSSDPDLNHDTQLVSNLLDPSQQVPEPSSIALVALGLLSLGLMSRRRVKLST